LLLLLAR